MQLWPLEDRWRRPTRPESINETHTHTAKVRLRVTHGTRHRRARACRRSSANFIVTAPPIFVISFSFFTPRRRWSPWASTELMRCLPSFPLFSPAYVQEREEENCQEAITIVALASVRPSVRPSARRLNCNRRLWIREGGRWNSRGSERSIDWVVLHQFEYGKRVTLASYCTYTAPNVARLSMKRKKGRKEERKEEDLW